MKLKYESIRNNIEFSGIFLAHEFKLLLETTHSMNVAVDYLIRIIPKPLSEFSILFLKKQNIEGKFPEEAVILLFDILQLPLLVETIQKIITDWHNDTFRETDAQFKLENELKNQIELYNESFTSWKSLISALVTLIPLFGIFLLMMLGYKPLEYFPVIISYLIIITICLYYLDPFSILFLQESGILNRQGLSGLSAASFTEKLAKNLQLYPAGEVALKQTIFQFIKEKKINFIYSEIFQTKNHRFQSNQGKNLPIDLLSITPEFYLASLFTDMIGPNKFLQLSLLNAVYSRIKLVIDFTMENSNIDIKSTINHLYSLSDIQKNLEKSLQRRFVLIHSEYRKNLLLLIIQSCILGLLIGLDPIFSVIRSLSIIYSPSEFYDSINSINSFQTISLLFILCIVYLSIQILTIKAIYKYSNKIMLIIYLVIITLCFMFGYNFVRAVITPSFG